MDNFKPATENDIPLIRSLAEKSWNSAYKGIISQEQIDYMLGEMYSEKEILSQISKTPNYFYWLISDGNEPVGFIGYEHHYEIKTTKLHRIYLVPEAKGKGLGSRAIDFLKQKTAEFGDNRIILNVNKQNGAQKVYESNSFKVYGETVLDIGNGYVMDDFLMEYVL